MSCITIPGERAWYAKEGKRTDLWIDYDFICGISSADYQSLLARYAAISDTPMLTDVVKMINQTTFQRNIYAGNVLETVQVSSHPIVMTIRSSSHITPELVKDNQPSIIAVEVQMDI